MVSSGQHQKAPVAKALKDVKGSGMDVEEDHNGHRWGRVICPSCGQKLAVWSTPKSADQAAKQIRRFAAKHQHPS